MIRRLALLGLVLGPACFVPDPAPHVVIVEPIPSAPLDADEVSWAGCASVVDMGRCELDERPLTFWVPGPASGWTWTLDGEPLPPTHSEPVQDGTRVTISPGAAAGERRLVLTDPGGVERWDTTLEPYRLASDRLAEGDEIDRLLATKDMQARLRLARALTENVASAAPHEALARVRFARRLSYDRSDPDASAPRVRPLLQQMFTLAEAQERWGERCEATSVGLVFALQQWDLPAATRWERWVEPCSRRAPRWEITLSRIVGSLRLRQGRLAEAAERLKRARRGAAKLGLPSELFARKKQIELWARTERWDRVRRELASLEALPLERCQRASLDSDIGFQRILAMQREIDLGDPRPVLRRALASHAHGGACTNESLRNHDWIKLGFAAALYDDLHGLQQAIAAVDGADLRGKYPAQYHELRVLSALARDQPADASEALADMANAGIDTQATTVRWRHAMLRARVAARVGEVEHELHAYRDAEATLDEPRHDPLSGPLRDRWMARSKQSAVLLMERLLELERPEDAAVVARHARHRSLAIHDALALRRPHRDPSRRLPVDPSPRSPERPWTRHPDELTLLVVPGAQDSWLAFVASERAVLGVSRLAALPEGSAPSWWDRWDTHLQTASRVRVLASGDALGIPFHLLGWRGRPLLLERVVTYGLDLVPPPHPTSTGPYTALVSFANADPLRDLGPYRSPVAHVDAVLDGVGWSSELHEGPETNRGQMLARLPSTSLLHYYGHGERRDPEGRVQARPEDDLGTTIALLPGGAPLDPSAVLDLDAVPRWVVLLGCQLGLVDLRGWTGGLNLAHAFLLRGSEQVVASTASLGAATAAQLGEALYEGQTPQTFDLAIALKDAFVRHARAHDTLPPWKDLRVWSR